MLTIPLPTVGSHRASKSVVQKILHVSPCRSRFCGRERRYSSRKLFDIKILREVIEKKHSDSLPRFEAVSPLCKRFCM